MKLKITASLLIFFLQWIDPVHPTRVDIDYYDAFDQEAIHQKFKPLLTTVGCKKNIDDTQEPLKQGPIIIALDIQDQQWDEYQQACLNRLNHARRIEILRPLFVYGMTLGCMAATGTLAWYLLPDSYGRICAISGCLYSSFRNFCELCQSLYSLSTHPLNELEKNFALNKCFIPKSLWPSLISAFQRTQNDFDDFDREKAMNYIDFTLGLTVFRPRERPPFSHAGPFRDEIRKQLFNKMNIFFEDDHFKDDCSDGEREKCYSIQASVLNFVDTQRFETPLYIYGRGRDHKKRFVNNLYEWLTDGNPNSVLFEHFVITSPDELEGSEEKPGVFLQVLRNQCVEKKNTSLVIIEGINTDWLNRKDTCYSKDMCSSARRVFKYADHSNNMFSCRYLQRSYGDVYLDMPSMFVVAFGDEQLKDKGLRDRFTTMSWHE